MGWQIGWDHNLQRDIGYGVPAYCDHPGCNEEIDRGLGWLCRGNKDGGFECLMYFCEKHNPIRLKNGCHACKRDVRLVKREHPDWIKHKLTDPSWEQWRLENPDEVLRLKDSLVS